jgi:hypothetical protein
MSDYNDNNYDAIFDSEYEDSLVLTGLDSIDEQEELLGKIMRNPKRRRKLAKKVFSPKTTVVGGNSTSRDDFQKRFKQLPSETRTQLLNKQKQLVDTGLYVVKEVSNNKIVKMFQDDDNKVIAKSNVSGGKLEKGNFFTVKGIQLLYGVAGVDEDYKHVNFGILPDFIRNGEFEFVANGSILIPSMSLEVFNTTGMNRRMGYFELVNPKMIETQQPMDLEMEWGENAPAKAYIKAILHGTSVAKY